VSEHLQLEEDLVALALGEVAEPRRSELLSHLTGCLRCRHSYSEIVGAIDATVPVAPETQPPPGFDLRVLSALGIGEPQDRPSRWNRLTTRSWLLAAAAVLVVVVAGGTGLAAVLDDPAAPGTGTQNAPALADDTVPLHTPDGETVGTAAEAWMDDSRVLVVAVSEAPVGVRYTCRVRLATGGIQVLGRWESSSADGGTWVMAAPQGDINVLELVTDSGNVWSYAQLP
jgi:hypothetical protein